ncbi:PspC domain-containing protein [Sphingomonas sp.]|uniref:PspC domain-containing protein n=1 Tax=Sphingomonas sp. TaxID=28214 RepID=UPI0035C7B1B9
MDDQASSSGKPARESIFGVCAALASDFGFNPLWLRLAIGAGLMVDMEAALGAYVVLGVIVLISRLAAPDAKPRQLPVSEATTPVPSEQDLDEVPLPRAA